MIVILKSGVQVKVPDDISTYLIKNLKNPEFDLRTCSTFEMDNGDEYSIMVIEIAAIVPDSSVSESTSSLPNTGPR